MTQFYALERTVEPEDEPVTLAEAMQQVREFTDASEFVEDELLRLITTAREWVETESGRALVDQTWRLTLFGSISGTADTVAGTTTPCACPDVRNEILLRRSPVLEVISVKSVDTLGVETDIDASAYELREAGGKWPRLYALDGSTWNIGSELRITYRAGYIDHSSSPATGTVPARFKQSLLLYLESLYNKDQEMMEKLQAAAANLLRGNSSELSMA